MIKNPAKGLSVPVNLPHVQLIRVGRVVLPVPQLLDLSTEGADHRLGEGVLVELLDVLGEIVLGLLLLPAQRAHAGRRGLLLLALFIAAAMDGSQVGIFALLGRENFLALFTFQAD